MLPETAMPTCQKMMFRWENHAFEKKSSSRACSSHEAIPFIFCRTSSYNKWTPVPTGHFTILATQKRSIGNYELLIIHRLFFCTRTSQIEKVWMGCVQGDRTNKADEPTHTETYGCCCCHFVERKCFATRYHVRRPKTHFAPKLKIAK